MSGFDDDELLTLNLRPAPLHPVSVDPHRPSLLELTAPAPPSVDEAPLDGRTIRPPGGTAKFHERYELLGVLGRGGMGEVRLCHDRTIGREVAMKVILTDFDSSPRSWRFIREARVQGQLEHPGVVPLYDLGVDPGGNLYFTMRRIHGTSLSRVLASAAEGRGATHSRRRLLSVLAQVCMAAEYFHSRGVIHRDLKPANVMLGEFGEVYVLDWGIAKLMASVLEEEAAPIIDASQASSTGQGSVIGTPGYMAPEQLRGDVEKIGPASDVYALGAILFELLTLEPLHPQEYLQAKLLSVLTKDGISPLERAPHRAVPEALDAIVVRATRQLPEDRFATGGAMAAAIEAYLDDRESR